MNAARRTVIVSALFASGAHRKVAVSRTMINRQNTLPLHTHTRMMIYRQANGEENNTRVPTPASDEKGACHMVTGMTLHTCHIIFSYK